jgi:acyl-CoA dehydrogenase
MYVGITAAALEQALQYARDRHAFGRPIGTFQAVQHPLADIAIELEQIRLITAKAAWLQSLGRDCALEAAMAKLAASETAVRATDRSMRVLAGYGMVEESPLERLFRDARLGPFSPISNEMVRNFVRKMLRARHSDNDAGRAKPDLSAGPAIAERCPSNHARPGRHRFS